MFLKAVVIFAMIGVSYAAQALGPVPEKPKEFAHKEGCYMEEINDVVPFGTRFHPKGQCMEILCGQKLMTYSSCGSVSASSSKLYVTELDLTKEYPDCCPTLAVKH